MPLFAESPQTNAGCGFSFGIGTFMAHRMVQAPNTYPRWFAPKAPVLLGFHPKFFTNFPKQYAVVGPPEAQLCYRIIRPADYHFRVTSTNWTERWQKRTEFDFYAKLPAATNAWTARPRGTVVLLHGYALAQFSMMPWALRLAQDGWQCVLVDLRGHGQSTGKRIYYGTHEVTDLRQLLDALGKQGDIAEPVSVMGESYGAVMALRWKCADPRIQNVVAITPYAGLSNAVMNLRSIYAGWLPKILIRAGIKKLPSVLGTNAADLDTTTALRQTPIAALFVTADGDKITPPAEVDQLYALALPGSKMILVPNSTHETVTYHFPELVPPIEAWLNQSGR